MQDKDEELQSVYKRLSEACKERSDVRGALIGTQTELAETQAELDAWTHELDSFQQVGLAPSKWSGTMKGCSYGSACHHLLAICEVSFHFAIDSPEGRALTSVLDIFRGVWVL